MAPIVSGEPQKIEIHRIRGGMCRTLSAHRLGGDEFLPEAVGEPGNDLVLHVEEISDRLVEPFGPEMRPCFGFE